LKIKIPSKLFIFFNSVKEETYFIGKTRSIPLEKGLGKIVHLEKTLSSEFELICSMKELSFTQTLQVRGNSTR